MSFGYSVGDFIAAADKAFLVWKKCKSAPEDYADLAHRVHVLAVTLSASKDYLDQNASQPSSSLQALTLARKGCLETLGEVEELLSRYTDVGNIPGSSYRQRPYLQVAKFITKDIEGLKAKLSNHAHLLQLGLNSTTRSTVTDLQAKLDTLLQQYQQGARRPSVFSSVSNNTLQVDQGALLRHITTDLEDDYLNADAIEMNKPYIASWLSEVVADGRLDDVPRLSVADDSLSLAYSLTVSTPTGDADSRSTMERVSSMSNLAIKTIPENVSTSSGSIFTDHLSTCDMSSNADTSVSAFTAITPPETETVFPMLLSYFKTDPDAPMNAAIMSYRINESFRQQDWSHRGFLTRKEVMTVCEDIIKHLEHTQSLPTNDAAKVLGNLQGFVIYSDLNRDGQLSEQEYQSLIQRLIENVATLRHRSILKELDTTSLYHAKDCRNGLPWCEKKSAHKMATPPLDVFSGDWKPERAWMAAKSFTAMAKDAESVVNTIGTFERDWLLTLSGSLRRYTVESLVSVRKAALAFTLFEDPDKGLRLSDLDAMILSYGLRNESTLSRASSQEILNLQQLKIAMIVSFDILCHIKAFSGYLPANSKERLNQKSSFQRSKTLQQTWSIRHMSFRARIIAQKVKKWDDQVRQKIIDVRQWKGLADIKMNALLEVKQSMEIDRRVVTRILKQESFRIKVKALKLFPTATDTLKDRKFRISVSIDYEEQPPWVTPKQKGKRGHDHDVELVMPFMSKRDELPPIWKVQAYSSIKILLLDADGRSLPTNHNAPDQDVLIRQKIWKDEDDWWNNKVQGEIVLRTSFAEAKFEVEMLGYEHLRSTVAPFKRNWAQFSRDIWPLMHGNATVMPCSLIEEGLSTRHTRSLDGTEGGVVQLDNLLQDALDAWL
ncbi:hypothetical protein EJ04DRAFT_578747 [Polyplosphaeria fusca]|uniref:Uncharacterized protein n=1 Tax=Polyplosphaeria fusca TaxID=682080 RepID=A0A9P4QQN0_9PLEO|nr:hypothetical protein EJ04DRAFT_578747 [Polyplosphaeria fusca]